MFSYVRIACISPDLFDFTGLFSVGLVSREWGRVVCWVSMADPAEGARVSLCGDTNTLHLDISDTSGVPAATPAASSSSTHHKSADG